MIDSKENYKFNQGVKGLRTQIKENDHFDENWFSTNSPRQHVRKSIENSWENMNTDVRVKRVYIKILFPGPGSSLISLNITKC